MLQPSALEKYHHGIKRYRKKDKMIDTNPFCHDVRMGFFVVNHIQLDITDICKNMVEMALDLLEVERKVHNLQLESELGGLPNSKTSKCLDCNKNMNLAVGSKKYYNIDIQASVTHEKIARKYSRRRVMKCEQ